MNNVKYQSVEAEKRWLFKMTFIQLVSNPPNRLIMFLICLLFSVSSLIINDNTLLVIFVTLWICVTLVAIIQSVTCQNKKIVISVLNNQIGCGDTIYINWFPASSIVRISWTFGRFKIIHLESGHQFLIPDNIYFDKHFNEIIPPKIMNSGNQ